MSLVSRSVRVMVATIVRPMFQQEGREQAQAQLAAVCKALEARLPKVVALL